MKSFAKKIGHWLGQPIELRTTEIPDVKTDYYIAVEKQIKQMIDELLERQGTNIFWHSGGKDLIIRNKLSGVRVFITLTKQRIMWESNHSTDTIPTTQTFIETLFSNIKNFEDKLFDTMSEDMLEKRQNRLTTMTDEIIKQEVLDISTII